MLEMTKKEPIPEISARIKALRKHKGWNQSKLAQEAKVTDGAVKMWETGKRFPRGANLKNLAAALGVSESYILAEDIGLGPVAAPSANMDRASRILAIQAKLTSMTEVQLEHVDDAIEQILSSDAISFDLSLESPKNKQK